VNIVKIGKKKIIWRVLISIPAVLAALVVLLIIVINTQRFRDFLRSEIIVQAARRAGIRLEIGGLAADWTGLAFDFTDIVVRGADDSAPARPPLFQAKHLQLVFQFLPLLHRDLELRSIILDQPVMRLRIDSRGHTNLPSPPQSSSNSNGTDALFNLAIQDCAIHSGEIYYNDAQVPLDAELHDLKFDAGYSRLTGEYKGSISYDRGRVSSPLIQPIEHAVQAQFTASRTVFTVSPLTFTSGASRLSANARLTNYANPDIDGKYEGNLITSELANALKLASMPVGEVALDGTFGYHAKTPQSFLAGLSINGQMRSGKLTLRTSQGTLMASALRARYELKDANVRVDGLVAQILGGQAKASWEMLRADSSSPLSRLNFSLKGVSLTNASDALGPRDLNKLRLSGATNLEIQAAWSGPVQNAIAHVRLAVSNPEHAIAVPSSIPVNGLVQAGYDGPRNRISFAQSYLQTSSTKITISGTLDSRGRANSDVDVVATTGDLHEVGSLAILVENTFRPPGHPPIVIPNLRGSGTLSTRVTGSPRDPRIQGQLSVHHLAVDRSRWKSLALNLEANSSEVEIQNGKLVGDPRGQITFGGRASLQNWSLAANSPVSLQAAITDVSIADAQEIAELHYPVTGIVSAQVSVTGTKHDLEGNGTLAVSHGSVWNEPLNKLTVNAQFQQGSVHTAVDIEIPAGKILADATYKLATQEYDAAFHADGLKLDAVPALQHGGTIGGVLNISESGHGTIQDPELEVNLAVPQLQIHEYPVSNLTAQVTVAHNHGNLTLHSVVDQGSVDVKGNVELTGQRNATGTVDVKALPIAAVLANFLPARSSNVKGQTQIHLSFQGPLKAPDQLQAHLAIPTLDVAYGGAQIALAHPLKADYRDGTVTLAPAQLQGTGTNLTFGGTIPLRSNASAAYAVSADGSVDLSALQKFAPSVRSSGRIDVHITSQGKSSEPDMKGELRITNVALSTDTIPVGIEDLNAQINLSGTRADIVKFSGTAGGGTISAEGFVAYGRDTNFNVALNAQSVRVRYPAGLRSILSGRVNLNGTPNDSNLTGRVLVDRLSFTQAFDLSNFAGQFSEDSSGGESSNFETDMKLNVAVQSAQDMNLASSKVSLAGSANLNVTGTLANPVLLGRISLTNGEVFFLSKRFEVQSGTIQFVNPARTEPVLSLYIKTTVEQYDVTLNLSGSMDRLRTSYTSDPSLPPADIIHLLAFGSTTAEAASSPTQSAAMGAESVLAGGVSRQVAGKLENVTGISQLTIDPLATNSQGNVGSQVAIQERVTGSLLLTVSTDVTNTQGQTVELEYQVNRRTSITALRDQNGGYAIGVRVHKEF
jgi:translocation and assembly module TamB